MLLIYRWFAGILRVKFYGDGYERILNLAARNRITLWNSQLVSGGMETNITVKNFKALRGIIRGTGIRLHILKRSGLPFKLEKHKSRTGLLVGFVIFVAFLEIMSNFIWVIDVTGNNRLSQEEILELCNSVNIKTGIRADSVNPKNRREKLLLKTDKLAWVSLNVEGSRLTVNVSETKNEDKKDTPCNLVANADGIIKKIDVSVGNCIVKVGDTVKKGDVLVSGIIEKADSTEFVVSQGVVEADTKTSITIDGKYKRKVETENGNVKKKSVLELFNLKIPLYLGSEAGEYNSEFSTKTLRLFDSDLPIKLHSREFRFIDEYEITLSREELCKELELQISKCVKTESFTIDNKNFSEISGGIKLTAIISAEQNIAEKSPLSIATE